MGIGADELSSQVTALLAVGSHRIGGHLNDHFSYQSKSCLVPAPAEDHMCFSPVPLLDRPGGRDSLMCGAGAISSFSAATGRDDDPVRRRRAAPGLGRRT